MSEELEMIRHYLEGSLSVIPNGADPLTDYMTGYQKAIKNVHDFVRQMQERERRTADAYWDKQEAA